MQNIIGAIETGHNVLVTGQAEIGKTMFLRDIQSVLRARGEVVPSTASSGIASLHLTGETIHRWSGIQVRSQA